VLNLVSFSFKFFLSFDARLSHYFMLLIVIFENIFVVP